MTQKMSPAAAAMLKVLRENPNTTFTLEELAKLAGVECRSGYLRSVKAELGTALKVGETEKVVTRKVKVNTYTYAE